MVSELYVLSAAHCADPFLEFDVILGATNKYAGGERFKVESYVIHPEYQIGTKSDSVVAMLLEHISFIFSRKQ